MDELCHSEFWNGNKTWWTNNPEFATCFQENVLVWIPCFLLFLGIPIDLYNAHKSKYCNIPWGSLNIIRVCISVALIGITCVTLLASRDLLEIITLIIQFIAFITSGITGVLNRRRGIVSSGVKFIFWISLAIFAIPQFITKIQIVLSENDTEEPQWKSIGFIIYFVLVALQAILHCFADKTPTSSNHFGECRPVILNEEFKSSFLRKILFAWFEPLAWKGYRKPLTENNLEPLDINNSSELMAKKFQNGWQKSYRKKYGDIMNQLHSRKSYDFSKSRDNVKKRREISIIPIIIREFSGPLWSSGIIKIFLEILNFSRPYILGLLIRFTSNNEPLWHGIFYMFVLFFVTILMGLLNGQFYHKSFIMGFRVKSALIGAIFRKSLTISMAAHSDVTSGQIVNLMSVDAQRFFDIASYLHVIWSAPIITSFAIYFLWQLLGVSAFVGLLVFILLVPINSYVSSKVKLWQGRRMKVADERVKMISEIITGIKILKLNAWESSFGKFVNDIRENELKIIKHSSMISICNIISTSMAPYIVTLVTFATFVLIDNENVLTPEIVFVSLTLFNIMRQPMIFFPMAILQIMQSYVGIKRINTFLNRDDIARNNVQHIDNGINAVHISNGSFSWYDGNAILQNINLKLKTHSLVAVVGPVGSGKSTLIASILGETQKLSGSVNTCGSIAYVSQQAWIQNATLKQNILFGKPLNNRFYNQVLDACALREDIKFLPAGDQTEIGERGINLSGGQKQRIALARAIYSKSRIYLFDDPLSAVDTHVGQHLFENIIGPNGLLQNATRLLVTHSITYLPLVSMVHVMKNGEITESGTLKELINKKGAFAEFVQNYMQNITDEKEVSKIREIVGSVLEETANESLDIKKSPNSDKKSSADKKQTLESPATKPKVKGKRDGTLIEKDESPTGSVNIGVYKRYFHSVGIYITLLILLTSILSQAFSVYGNIWLADWSANTDSQIPYVRDMYLGVYGGIGMAQVLVTVIMYLALIYGCLNASRDIHNNLLNQMFNLPVTFFETTPQGRILNKFSKDMNMIDGYVPLSIKLLIGTLFSVVSLLIIISISTPKFMFVIIPIGLMYYTIQSFFIATSRQLRRIMSMARAPVFSHLCETLSGQTTIRAFNVQERFIEESDARVDFNQRCTYPAMIGNRWLALRLDVIGSLVVLFASLFAILGRDSLTGATVGLSISYALQVTASLNFLTRNSCDMEMNIVANERLEEYNEIKKEAVSNETAEDPNWPDKGEIVFEDYKVRYRDHLDLVLKGLTFSVNGGEKVGIVGRTGAGKTSLSLGLFRILEAAAGRILIDGVDISKLNLHYLRSRLTIIPQDPFMFSGTIRINVDPLRQHTDAVIWTALEQSSIKEFIKNLPNGLDTVVTEGGNNLSVGQRQLICLARALLRKTKILILDEATASIDLETNDLVQKTIRSEFSDCTVLTIAHRLSTIMDSDKVLVLQQGLIVEYDSPTILMNNKSGVFYGMAQNEGLLTSN